MKDNTNAKKITAPLLLAVVYAKHWKEWSMPDWFGTWKVINLSGFRSRKSPIDHLIRLETFIREASIKQEHLVAVFFILKTADDTTWKYGIVRDLKNLGLEGRMAIS